MYIEKYSSWCTAALRKLTRKPICSLVSEGTVAKLGHQGHQVKLAVLGLAEVMVQTDTVLCGTRRKVM